ncbi:MAG: hypothetical protein PWP24_1313 [Clostridiales bacterium]|nr:hypothetical protein [Clostridiales bacterium]
MIVFNTDLDNTIIYSYKHDIGLNKRNVEIYNNREVSFITDKTYGLLQKVKNEMMIVPTTTRTIEQYQRINLGIGKIKYALVCNGGILLVDGERDETWYDESVRLVETSLPEMIRGQLLLEKEKRRIFDIRFIEHLFIFTKCIEPERVVNKLKSKLNMDLVDVMNNGVKVYIVPRNLDKGMAIQRFRKRLMPEYVIAAGDSSFDIPMLNSADIGLAPSGFKEKFSISSDIYEMNPDCIFSEALLGECLRCGDKGISR